MLLASCEELGQEVGAGKARPVAMREASRLPHQWRAIQHDEPTVGVA